MNTMISREIRFAAVAAGLLAVAGAAFWFWLAREGS